MSTPDLPPEAWVPLREAKNFRKNAMEFAIKVDICFGRDGASPHYVRIGDGGERTFLSMSEVAELPPVNHFLYQGPPPLRIVNTIMPPEKCEFCTHKEA